MEDELYKDRILAECRSPRNYGLKDPYTHAGTASNPLCGDSILVRLLVHNGVISDVSFENRGCVISTASASFFLDFIKGKQIEDIRTSEDGVPVGLLLVPIMPLRITCATLVLEAIRKAL